MRYGEIEVFSYGRNLEGGIMNTCRTVRKRARAFFGNNSGIAAVEVGITLLPFLLVVFGTAEFGWYFLHTHTMNSAVSEGIRIGATGAGFE